MTYSIPPAGFTTTTGPTELHPARSLIEVAFEGDQSKYAPPNLVGVFDGRKLVEGKWLNWDGNIADSPCGG